MTKSPRQWPSFQTPKILIKYWNLDTDSAIANQHSFLFALYCSERTWGNNNQKQKTAQSVNLTVKEATYHHLLKVFFIKCFFFCPSQLYAVFGFLVVEIMNPGALKIHTITWVHHHIITSQTRKLQNIMTSPWSFPFTFYICHVTNQQFSELPLKKSPSQQDCQVMPYLSHGGEECCLAWLQIYYIIMKHHNAFKQPEIKSNSFVWLLSNFTWINSHILC